LPKPHCLNRFDGHRALLNADFHTLQIGGSIDKPFGGVETASTGVIKAQTFQTDRLARSQKLLAYRAEQNFPVMLGVPEKIGQSKDLHFRNESFHGR